jgi:hypothetical protein
VITVTDIVRLLLSIVIMLLRASIVTTGFRMQSVD